MPEPRRFKGLEVIAMETETRAVPEKSLNCDITLSLNIHLFEIPYNIGSDGEGALSASIGLYDVFDRSSADRTARVGHLFQAEATGVAETHVSAGVDDRVHCVFVAD